MSFQASRSGPIPATQPKKMSPSLYRTLPEALRCLPPSYGLCCAWPNGFAPPSRTRKYNNLWTRGTARYNCCRFFLKRAHGHVRAAQFQFSLSFSRLRLTLGVTLGDSIRREPKMRSPTPPASSHASSHPGRYFFDNCPHRSLLPVHLSISLADSRFSQAAPRLSAILTLSPRSSTLSPLCSPFGVVPAFFAHARISTCRKTSTRTHTERGLRCWGRRMLHVHI